MLVRIRQFQIVYLKSEISSIIINVNLCIQVQSSRTVHKTRGKGIYVKGLSTKFRTLHSKKKFSVHIHTGKCNNSVFLERKRTSVLDVLKPRSVRASSKCKQNGLFFYSNASLIFHLKRFALFTDLTLHLGKWNTDTSVRQALITRSIAQI